MAARIDPDLLYVECGQCGAPLLWGQGKTLRILQEAEVDVEELDASCMIISNGCPMCDPGAKTFSSQLVRLDPEPQSDQRSLAN